MSIQSVVMSILDQKRTALIDYLTGLGSVVVAYSGGVDSAYLAYVAHQVLGRRMLAVIADSPSLARDQYADAIAFASEQQIAVRVVRTLESENPDYVRNDANRCYYCKDELFTGLERVQQELGFASVAFGMNTDDQSDFRPGQRAAELHGVVAPLLDAGLSKRDVRELARAAGLRLWNKPSSPCLASRVEYGRAVTPEILAVVEKAEEILQQFGFRQFRVRHHGDIARVELARDEMPQVMRGDIPERLSAALKALGFKFVTLDLDGYRSGSLNAVLPVSELAARRP